jgi:hypothetical protein
MQQFIACSRSITDQILFSGPRNNLPVGRPGAADSTCLVAPALKLEAQRIDEVGALVEGVNSRATVQNRLEQSSVVR